MAAPGFHAYIGICCAPIRPRDARTMPTERKNGSTQSVARCRLREMKPLGIRLSEDQLSETHSWRFARDYRNSVCRAGTEFARGREIRYSLRIPADRLFSR